MIMRAIEIAYQNLQNAIVLQAVEDYRNALNGKTYTRKIKPAEIIEECEKFFRSDYYRHLTKLNGEWLIEQLKKEHIEKLREENKCKSN